MGYWGLITGSLEPVKWCLPTPTLLLSLTTATAGLSTMLGNLAIYNSLHSVHVYSMPMLFASAALSPPLTIAWSMSLGDKPFGKLISFEWARHVTLRHLDGQFRLVTLGRLDQADGQTTIRCRPAA